MLEFTYYNTEKINDLKDFFTVVFVLIEKCSVKLLRRKGKSLKSKETRGKSCLSTFVERKTRSTVNRGKEFAGYLELEKKLKVDVFFVDPYSSWRRENNEDINGLIIELFP